MAAGAISLLLVNGCSSFRTELGRPVSAEACGFVLGKSRAENVLQELGPPDSATKVPDGFAFLYEHSIVREFQLGITVNYSFLRYFKFIHAWNSLDQEAFLFTFDSYGILENAGGKKWREDLGGGTAVQCILNVMSLSDLSRFLRPADAHEWGEALLEPAPIALNSAQSLRTGEHGLRQARMAPDYAGQHTLEMAKPKTEKERRRIKKNYQIQR